MRQTYTYNPETKSISVCKNCMKCTHVAMCKFRENMKALAKSNVMYEMTEYSEWNNILETFDFYASCQFYKPMYQLSPLGLATDPEIISHIIYNYEIKELQKIVLESYMNQYTIANTEYFFFQPDIKISIDNDSVHIVLKTTNKEIGYGSIVYDNTLTITDILNGWHLEKIKN